MCFVGSRFDSIRLKSFSYAMERPKGKFRYETVDVAYLTKKVEDDYVDIWEDRF